MNIVIIGMGKLGKMVADNLSKEEHNITVIDNNSHNVEDVINQFVFQKRATTRKTERHAFGLNQRIPTPARFVVKVPFHFLKTFYHSRAQRPRGRV